MKLQRTMGEYFLHAVKDDIDKNRSERQSKRKLSMNVYLGGRVETSHEDGSTACPQCKDGRLNSTKRRLRWQDVERDINVKPFSCSLQERLGVLGHIARRYNRNNSRPIKGHKLIELLLVPSRGNDASRSQSQRDSDSRGTKHACRACNDNRLAWAEVWEEASKGDSIVADGRQLGRVKLGLDTLGDNSQVLEGDQHLLGPGTIVPDSLEFLTSAKGNQTLEHGLGGDGMVARSDRGIDKDHLTGLDMNGSRGNGLDNADTSGTGDHGEEIWVRTGAVEDFFGIADDTGGEDLDDSITVVRDWGWTINHLEERN